MKQIYFQQTVDTGMGKIEMRTIQILCNFVLLNRSKIYEDTLQQLCLGLCLSIFESNDNQFLLRNFKRKISS